MNHINRILRASATFVPGDEEGVLDRNDLGNLSVTTFFLVHVCACVCVCDMMI